LCQVFCCPVKFSRQTEIRFRTLAHTIDRLPEAAWLRAQSRADVGQVRVIFAPDQQGDHCLGFGALPPPPWFSGNRKVNPVPFSPMSDYLLREHRPFLPADTNPVRLVKENVLATVPTCHHLMDRARMVDACSPSHY